MKKTRKLIPALAMLLISAVMMSTASFAWFSMNTQVSAGSMTVKATTNANLYIASGVVAQSNIGDITGTSITNLNVEAKSVKPADLADNSGTVTVRDAATYKDSQAPTVGSAGSAETWTTIGSFNATAANDDGKSDGTITELSKYCALAYVTIARKATTGATYSLTATCTVNAGSGSSDLNKALRAGMLINGVFYEVENTAETVTGNITYTFDAVTGLSDNTVYTACLVLWFEGEDPDCYVNNAVDLTENVANWTFVSN